MPGKVFVSGGGGAKDSLCLDKAFVDSLSKKKILYLPFGLERDLVDYDSCYEWLVDTLKNVSKENVEIDMWVNINKITWDDLADCGGIYIGGGKSTGRLLNQLRKVGLDTMMRKFLDENGVIY